MDRYLKNGSWIKNPDRSGEYEIRGIIGTGASCVVYLADFLESSGARTEHLLKEYNPKAIRIERDDHGILRVSDEKDHAAFEAGLQRFEAGYQMQLNVRRCSDMKNSTSNIQSIFEANGTRYIDMTVMEGYTYDQVQEDSLYDLLRRIKTITEVVANYHKNGLLHLDIKPENILALPETVEMVQMFDYDSVTPKKDVIHSAFLSYTQSWAAQEQILPNRRNRICEATDLFSIGEILFHKLMGRHSESHERRSFSSYRFDYSADIFAGVNPRVFGLLENILRHTVCNKCADRYQTATELMGKLTDAIALADPRKPFLQHHLPSKSAYFIGRDAQLQEIADRLKHTDKLFISGMGGMGKSELVKQYAYVYQDAYDAVIFAVCNIDLEFMILNDFALPIGNVQQWPDEKAQAYYTRKLNELKKLCSKRILIIVDNFNDLQDKALDALLRLNCKMLFTTRCDVTEYNYEQMELGTMAEEYVWDIFRTWYGRQPVDEERMYARQIIDLYQGHTMAVELIAKQMKASHISPKQMLDKLGAGGFRTGGRERVVHAKDGMHPKLNIHDHIRHLFDVSELNDEQVYILANLSLMPPSGISAELFHDWCQLDGYEDIDELAESGWLRQDSEADLISLHPVISDVMLDELGKDISICKEMLVTIDEAIQNDGFIKLPYPKRNVIIHLVNHMSGKICQIGIFPKFVIFFINSVAWKFYDHGFVETDIVQLEKCLSVYEGNSGVDDYCTSLLYNTLGYIYTEAEHFSEAERCFHNALRIYKQTSDDNSTAVAVIYDNLGSLYADWKKFEQAEKYMCMALQIRQDVLGEIHFDTALSYNNLGVLYRARGDFQKSENTLRKAAEIVEDLVGNKNLEIASVYNNLGLLYQDIGDLERAKKFCQFAFDIREDIEGSDVLSTAFSCESLGALFCNLNQHQEAIPYFLKSSEIFETILGSYHLKTATSYNNLGAAYLGFEDFDHAEKYLKIALKLMMHNHDRNCEETASIYRNLGIVYYNQGLYSNAIEPFKNALEILEALLGWHHISTILACIDLGETYVHIEDYCSAEEYYVRAKEMGVLFLERNHDTIRDIDNALEDLRNKMYS